MVAANLRCEGVASDHLHTQPKLRMFCARFPFTRAHKLKAADSNAWGTQAANVGGIRHATEYFISYLSKHQMCKCLSPDQRKYKFLTKSSASALQSTIYIHHARTVQTLYNSHTIQSSTSHRSANAVQLSDMKTIKNENALLIICGRKRGDEKWKSFSANCCIYSRWMKQKMVGLHWWNSATNKWLFWIRWNRTTAVSAAWWEWCIFAFGSDRGTTACHMPKWTHNGIPT